MMKNALKIALLAVALAVISGCSAQKRAERHVRRAVELCPEYVKMKAHVVDTMLTLPPFVDCTRMSLPAVLSLDTLYAATDHGTFIVSMDPADSSLRVGYLAAPQKVRYQDTLQVAQIVLPDPGDQTRRSGRFWNNLAYWLFGLGVGAALFTWLLAKILNNNHFTRK